LYWSAIPVITLASNNSSLEGYHIELLGVDNALEIKDAGIPTASIACRWSWSALNSSSRDKPGNADAWKPSFASLLNQRSRPARKARQPSKLSDVQRQAIARMIESGPIPAVHGVVHWRLIDLAQWIFEEFRISIAKQTLSRELRAMGYRKLSARPRHHAQVAGVIEDFKKTSPRAWMPSRARRRSTATR
jgi:transposase